MLLKESSLDPATATYRRVIPAGDYWMHVVKCGETLRIVDLKGNQAADTLFFNAHDYQDRYSAQDTIREQANIYLTTGTRLISNVIDWSDGFSSNRCHSGWRWLNQVCRELSFSGNSVALPSVAVRPAMGASLPSTTLLASKTITTKVVTTLARLHRYIARPPTSTLYGPGHA